VRRVVTFVLALLCLTTVLVAGATTATTVTTLTAAEAAAPSGGAASAYDTRLGPGECRLTGRVYVPGRGCSRDRCVPGSTLWKFGTDAELCEQRGRKGDIWAQPIAKPRCERLGRVWLAQINACASNPDRARTRMRDVPQCTDRRATYLNHAETEGAYDECLSPRKVRVWSRAARKEGTTLARVALERGRANCSYRGGFVMVDGLCTERQGPPAQPGGVVLIGDSVSWRAQDELAPREPDWVLDSKPGRRLDELGTRLDWMRAEHGEPDAVIVQLGTNHRRGYSEADFDATLATLPADVPVMFLLPYRERTPGNASQVRATRTYAGWIAAAADQRPLTCLADWPSYAAKHKSRLVDGAHPRASAEEWYARYVLRQWDACSAQLGR
jgi:hypothetical protein